MSHGSKALFPSRVATSFLVGSAFLATCLAMPFSASQAQDLVEAALAQSLPELCFDPLVAVKKSAAVPPQSADWPLEMRPGGDSPASAALIKAGLLTIAEAATPGELARRARFGEGRAPAAQALALSPAAAPYLRERVLQGPMQIGMPVIERRLCFGRLTVDRIMDRTPPVPTPAGLAVRVTYAIRIVDIAPWAALPEVRTAIPEVQAAFASEGRQRIVTLVQTGQGWQPLGSARPARQPLTVGTDIALR